METSEYSNNYDSVMDQKYDMDINQWSGEYDDDLSNETAVNGSKPKRARNNNGKRKRSS